MKLWKQKHTPPVQRQILKCFEFRCSLLHLLPAPVSWTGKALAREKNLVQNERFLFSFVPCIRNVTKTHQDVKRIS